MYILKIFKTRIIAKEVIINFANTIFHSQMKYI